MGMITIYRVEHISGDGIFRAEDEKGYAICNSFSFYDDLTNKHTKFPNARIDVNNFTDLHYCAFKSIRQLNTWIKKEWRQELKNAGFKFYEIEIDEKHCLIGKKQICFKKQHITNKKEILCKKNI